jgi:hypothetical protein
LKLETSAKAWLACSSVPSDQASILLVACFFWYFDSKVFEWTVPNSLKACELSRLDSPGKNTENELQILVLMNDSFKSMKDSPQVGV